MNAFFMMLAVVYFLFGLSCIGIGLDIIRAAEDLASGVFFSIFFLILVSAAWTSAYAMFHLGRPR